MSDRIDVLDHGFIRLVDKMGSDVSVVRAARVSYDADWRSGDDEGSDARLIRYLWRNRHTTPFEAVTFTFEVKAPIFVIRQWHRHRTWAYNEVSLRYTKAEADFYVPNPADIGVQSLSSKQARELVEFAGDHAKAASHAVDSMVAANRNAVLAYEHLLRCGTPRELARTVLPLATYTRMFATVSLLNLLKFLTLRTHPHAQMEIRVYAEAMRELIRPVVPVCLAAWEEGAST